MKNVVIIDAARTPIGKFQGSLEKVSSVRLAEICIKALLERNKLDPSSVDEVLMGNVLQAGMGQNVARQAAIAAGIPNDKTAMTVNMVCGSGMRAIAAAAQSIKCGDADLILAGGTENMNQAPYLLPKARTGYRMGNGELVDSMIHEGLWDIFNNYHMGITAENIAEEYNITREQQDEFAAASQQKAEKAIEEGKFTDEIVPVSIPQRKGDPVEFSVDEFPRKGVTAESLSPLKPAFKKDGTVTAGNASGINDGAAVLIVAAADTAEKLGLTPMAKVVSYGWHGVSPHIMGIGPIEATRKALAKADWSIDDLELIEANEAFAVQMVAVQKELGWNPDIINVNGGAVALGHPIGASGARIVTTLLYEMKKRNAKKGHATMCIGGGMGIASCFESV